MWDGAAGNWEGREMMGKHDNHFDAEIWADFVNDQLPGDQRQAMQDHLDAECEGCVKSSMLWRQVGEYAKREALYEPPEWAVRYVRNAFTASNWARETKGSILRIPRLVLDSFWQMAPAGVRSGAHAPRHLLYTSEDVAIEMQLEREPNSETMSVTGLVSNVAVGPKSVAGIPVRLTTGHGEIAAASTNKFGEFRLAFIPEDDLRFNLDLQNGEVIAILLGDTLSTTRHYGPA